MSKDKIKANVSGDSAVQAPKKEEVHILDSLSGSLAELQQFELAVSDPQVQQDTLTESVDEKGKRHHVFLFLGVLVLVLAFIGLFSSVKFVADAIYGAIDQTELKNELVMAVFPAVTTDIPAFNSMEELPHSAAVSSAIWRLILQGNTDNYEKLYGYYMIIPEVDVEASAKMLFNITNITHQTVGTIDLLFEYDSSTKSYTVPINPRYTIYYPTIERVTNVGELYTVDVNYMPPTALSIAGIRENNIPEKTMRYTISYTKGKATILSVKYIEETEHTHTS